MIGANASTSLPSIWMYVKPYRSAGRLDLLDDLIYRAERHVRRAEHVVLGDLVGAARPAAGPRHCSRIA